MGVGDSETKKAQALVLGGGIAGLSAAIALRSYFRRVSIIERGHYGSEPQVRKHAPQGAQLHVLLAGGLRVLSRLVPDLPRWLDDLGLAEGDLTRDVRMRFAGRWLPLTESGVPIRACTRPVLEHLLLRAAKQYDNVEIREGLRVAGLIGNDGRVVSGVRVVDEQGAEHELQADLVVDASGRSSRVLEWLEALSVEGVVEEVVDAKVSYSSCLFRPPPGVETKEVLVAASSRYPDQPVIATFMPVEDGNWLCATIGYGRVPLPRTPAELAERIGERLGEPYATHMLAAEPVSDIKHYRKTANRRRRFGQVEGWPERFVVLGDASCALNPRYGQGMTVAALGVELLVEQLRGHRERHDTLDGLSGRFQRALDRMLDTPWQMALMEDRLWEAHYEGRRLGLFERMKMRSSQRVFETVFSDIDTYIRFMRVAHMLQSPTHLMTPGTLAKVAIPRLRSSGGKC